jgi:hypothetical protein
MSYINMNHAGWVQSSIDAAKPNATKSEQRKAREHSKGWAAAPDKLNDFQKRAFDILGIVGGGIYNAPIAWDSVYWKPRTIICSWYKGFATFDFRDLTRFVFLCHEARIRGAIEPLLPRYLQICLTEREAAGAMHARHPSLDEALAAWREEFPSDHSIVYRAVAPAMSPDTTNPGPEPVNQGA